MKNVLIVLFLVLVFAIPLLYISKSIKDKYDYITDSLEYTSQLIPIVPQDSVKNEKVRSYDFLTCMYSDPYFPPHLVDKCKYILLLFAMEVEANEPQNLQELYVLSHEATRRINSLENEFFANNSEIETAARECLAMDIEFIAVTYGFERADVEELIAPRNW